MFCCHYHGFSCSQLGEDVTLLLRHRGLKPDINTDIPKLMSKSPEAQAGFHWGVAGVAEPSAEGLLDLKDLAAMVMASFVKYFWFLSHVMSVLGCGLLSSLSA